MSSSGTEVEGRISDGAARAVANMAVRVRKTVENCMFADVSSDGEET